MAEAFLVTTTNHLLAFDGSHCFYRVHSGKGLYYGLASDGDRIYVACRNQRTQPPDASTRSREEGSILVLDAASLHVADELQADFPMRDMHGMACIDDRLWITCSFDNLVAVYDLKGRRWTRWYPATDPALRGRDVNHFNTVDIAGDHLCVVAHNNGPSHLLFYDRSSLDLAAAMQLGCQAHDTFLVNGRIATCSSAEGVLLGSNGWIFRTGGFPRGVAFGRDSILIGISQIVSREKRHTVAGIVRRFTPQWCYSNDYVLEGVGMVLAIMPIQLAMSTLSLLEPWPHAQVIAGTYNHLAPGNVYKVGEGNVVLSPEWHAGENHHRWTAAREACLGVVVNPGETKIVVSATSGFPGAYETEVSANDIFLGGMRWTQSGECRSEFVLPGRTEGRCNLVFRVPHLWKPSECLPGNGDERRLGIGIREVIIE